MPKKFHIIYADPPWNYNRRNNTKTKFGGGAMNHYATMTPEQIKKLRVQEIAEDNCALFLWITFPKLAEGLALMEAWGFEYKTLGFSWHKTNKNGSLFFGVGAYAKSNCEVCLLGTRGKVGRHMDKTAPFPDPKEKLVVRSNYVSSAINSQKEKHSKKPDELRDRIVELFGDVSRIELFARNATDGWEIWGSDESINENSMQYKNIQDTLMGNDLNLDSREHNV